jgi:acetyl-CoA carboxylase carboxyltransferase component
MRKKLEYLFEKKSKAMKGGGDERIEKQHKMGKLTARERIEVLTDPGSFIENNFFVEHRTNDFGMERKKFEGDGVITGFGKINGRPVAVYAQDFTVLGGSLGEMHGKKIASLMDLAVQNRVPIIGLNDSGGARIQEGIKSLASYGDIFYRNTIASGVVPQISVIMGPCAGGAVYSPAITDFVFMVDNSSYMFVTGPQVIKTVTKEDVTFDELGGAEVHSNVSGVSHFVYDDDEKALKGVRELLSFLPQNNKEFPPIAEYDFSNEETEESLELREIVPVNPNKPYDMKDVINKVVDEGYFYEVQKHYASNIIVGFGRIAGISVGIIANNPLSYAGTIDVVASLKASRFIRFCDSFNIPLITLVDVPGFLPGKDQEHQGIIKHGAKLLYAYSEATVPKLTVILRKAYGGAYIVMSSKHLGADAVLAWPTAEIAVMGPEGAINIIFRKELAAAEDQEAERKKLIDIYKEKFANPYMPASLGYVDEVIDPAKTRMSLIKYLEYTITKKQEHPWKKHGNLPL